MSPRRVLMIVPFFPPIAGGGVYRALSFVRYLPRYGWEPTVITQRGDAYWVRDEGLVERVPASIPIIRTSTWSGQSLLAGARRALRDPGSAERRSSRGFALARRLASAVLMPDSYIGWYRPALRAAQRELGARDYHAIYSTSPPETSHLIGRALHGSSRLPWIADFRDPWMNLHMLTPPTRWHERLHRRLEASVCSRAHVVVTTGWHEKALLGDHAGARITRIPNGYDAEELESVASVAPPEAPMRIMHAGMLTQRRSANPFLRGVAKFLERQGDARSRLSIVFAGPREDANERCAVELGLGDIVEFRDSMPHGDALAAEKASHLLLLIKEDDARYRGMVPGKLYEYIGLRRPVLAIGAGGEAIELLRTLNRGEIADPARPDEIAQVLEKMFGYYRAGVLDQQYDLSERPELNRALITRTLAALLDRVTGEPTS